MIFQHNHGQWGFSRETHETHGKNLLPVPCGPSKRRPVRPSGRAPPGKSAFCRRPPGWPHMSLRAAPGTCIPKSRPFNAVNCDRGRQSRRPRSGRRDAEGDDGRKACLSDRRRLPCHLRALFRSGFACRGGFPFVCFVCFAGKKFQGKLTI